MGSLHLARGKGLVAACVLGSVRSYTEGWEVRPAGPSGDPKGVVRTQLRGCRLVRYFLLWVPVLACFARLCRHLQHAQTLST